MSYVIDKNFFYTEFKNCCDSFYSIYKATRINYSAYLSQNIKFIWTNLQQIVQGVESQYGYDIFNPLTLNPDLYFVNNSIYVLENDNWISLNSCLQLSILTNATFNVLVNIESIGYSLQTSQIKTSLTQLDSLNNLGTRYLTNNPDDLLQANPIPIAQFDLNVWCLKILGYNGGYAISPVVSNSVNS